MLASAVERRLKHPAPDSHRNFVNIMFLDFPKLLLMSVSNDWMVQGPVTLFSFADALDGFAGLKICRAGISFFGFF